jgi:hypothetical protein
MPSIDSSGSCECVSSIWIHAASLTGLPGPATTTLCRNAVLHYPTNRLNQVMNLGGRKLLIKIKKMEWQLVDTC